MTTLTCARRPSGAGLARARLVASAVFGVAAALGLLACPGGRLDRGSAAADPPAEWAQLLPNARQPLPGVLSGGQPSAEQLRAARAAGFKTVINLRMAGEPETDTEPARVAALGLSYLSIPVNGAAGMTPENARLLSTALETAERPLILHCGSGNRVGGLLALKAFYLDGMTAEEALTIGTRAGLTRLEPVVRQRLAGGGD